jgi:hypothetical protein
VQANRRELVFDSSDGKHYELADRNHEARLWNDVFVAAQGSIDCSGKPGAEFRVAHLAGEESAPDQKGQESETGPPWAAQIPGASRLGGVVRAPPRWIDLVCHLRACCLYVLEQLDSRVDVDAAKQIVDLQHKVTLPSSTQGASHA